MRTVYAPGVVLVLETGEYSDKSWHGPFRVLRPLDLRAQADEMTAEWTKAHEDWDEPGPHDLIGWLAAQGFIEDVEHETAHVGSYGRIEIEAQ